MTELYKKRSYYQPGKEIGAATI